MLRVEDIERSLGFYRGLLGFDVRERLEEDGRLVWAHLELGAAELMLSQQPGGVNVVPRGAVIHYLYPDDVRALHARVRDAGLEAAKLRTTEYRMLEFDVLDPDGYELWFGQPQ
jgi:catechol 2,3-dioxygenase-like lactoylglutathione lyase family enzyme